MQDLINKLMQFPTSRLAAIYNNAGRQKHNGINPESANVVMRSIEFVCGIRNISITGEIGTYELNKQVLEDLRGV